MSTALTLPAELTIYTVGELRPAWLAWLAWLAEHDDDDGAHADGAAVAEVDAAGVQLLLSLQRTLAREERRFVVEHASQALATACTTLGVATLLAPAAPGELA